MTKQTSWHVRPVWSESSLSAWRKLGSLATHWAHMEDSDQPGRMPRLIWVFAGRTVIFWGFVMRRLNYDCTVFLIRMIRETARSCVRGVWFRVVTYISSSLYHVHTSLWLVQMLKWYVNIPSYPFGTPRPIPWIRLTELVEEFRMLHMGKHVVMLWGMSFVKLPFVGAHTFTLAAQAFVLCVHVFMLGTDIFPLCKLIFMSVSCHIINSSNSILSGTSSVLCSVYIISSAIVVVCQNFIRFHSQFCTSGSYF